MRHTGADKTRCGSPCSRRRDARSRSALRASSDSAGSGNIIEVVSNTLEFYARVIVTSAFGTRITVAAA
jgi:hypothetical protein